MSRLALSLALFVLATLAAAPAYSGTSEPELVYRSKSKSITAPAVSGSTVAWIAGPRGKPGECAPGRKRLQLLSASGKVRVLSSRRGRNYETTCVYRPTVAGRFLLWATNP